MNTPVLLDYGGSTVNIDFKKNKKVEQQRSFESPLSGYRNPTLPSSLMEYLTDVSQNQMITAKKYLTEINLPQELYKKESTFLKNIFVLENGGNVNLKELRNKIRLNRFYPHCYKTILIQKHFSTMDLENLLEGVYKQDKDERLYIEKEMKWMEQKLYFTSIQSAAAKYLVFNKKIDILEAGNHFDLLVG